ncbi:MAG: FHA domain-containing protein [Gammaproteobacteria bacterium]|nr:FHA domain-containing protein [Gammaproteobacteria bacterium]
MNSDNGADDKTVIYTGASSPSARLVCLDTMLDPSLQDLDIELGVQDETIGRSDNNTISIKYNKISRNHARISFENNKWVIEDLNSANGVYINEQKIGKSAMGQGDIVVIGQVPFRFIIKNHPVGSAPPPPPSNDYVGDSGTMYAQHVGVIESLASNDEAEKERRENPPPPKPAGPKKGERKASTQPAKDSNPKPRGIFKYILMTLLLGGAVAAYFFWQQKSANQKIDTLYVRYSKNVQWFLEKYESNNTRTPTTTLDAEIDDLRKIEAGIDVSLAQGKNHQGLLQLKQQLLFLSFERKLLKMLRENAFYDADRLIKDTREEINKIVIRKPKDKQNFNGLLDLAETAVRFRRFSDQYPEPSENASRKPDEYELRKMNEVKTQLIDRKKSNYLLLSVTYIRLNQLLEDVEEEDIRLLNRWQEVHKRVAG